ncbi:MAG: hypothetical protein JO104_08225, partial [Candidatus Eremiobacteraeota bacterium]|nr:hypothetical protein [Candidatus Eremiobacteraeota bacterium]
MTLLRGRKDGLEVALAGRELDVALDELEARLAEQPGFYRGVGAVASFGTTVPPVQAVARLRQLMDAAGIALRA